MQKTPDISENEFWVFGTTTQYRNSESIAIHTDDTEHRQNASIWETKPCNTITFNACVRVDNEHKNNIVTLLQSQANRVTLNQGDLPPMRR